MKNSFLCVVEIESPDEYPPNHAMLDWFLKRLNLDHAMPLGDGPTIIHLKMEGPPK